MGAIKDLVDLVTQLANSVHDRRVAAELRNIQSLILNLQTEQASLHETNTKLREERLTLKEQIQEMQATIEGLSTAAARGPSDVPTCPNCSTSSKPFYMRLVPPDFTEILDATHECSKCKYNMKVKK